MPRNLRIVAAFLLVMLWAPGFCQASDPNGVWSSSTGSTVKLWANMQQVLVTVTGTNGQSWKYNGWWTRFGDYFSYQTNLGVYQAAFNGSNQIRVTGPDGSLTIWSRGQRSAPAPNSTGTGVGIAGMWSSSSGSSVQVNTQGNQVFVTLISKDGQRFQGSGRWLKAGSSFDYSLPGYPGVAICTIINANQINIVYGTTRSTWYRQ